MSTPLPRVLPARPSLEQQRNQARELLDAVRAHVPGALQRLRASHPRLAGRSDAELRATPPSLHDAQLVIAREYGFTSWPRLKRHIDDVVWAQRTRPVARDLAYYDARARGLVTVLSDGAPDTLAQVRQWHPAFADSADAVIRAAPFTLDDARVVYARAHGFATWRHFAAHLRRVAAGAADEPFLAILEAARAGHWADVAARVRAEPALARARGTNGNTLLNLIGALLPPPEPVADAGANEPRLDIVRLLLAAGADPNAGNDRGWTPLHQAGYRNDAPLAALLLSAGARVDVEAHGTGGTPLSVALFWGHRKVSEVLARAGFVPHNLRVAAGLGRADLVRACLTSDGTLTAEARAGRGFYRPHSGFPAWHPADDAQEVLDEALVWAAKAGRVLVLPLLVALGARLDADPYRGTPLAWAAFNGRVDAVAWLLDHGAPVNQCAAFGGPTHGEGVTALHLAAQADRARVAALLLARGADPTLRDRLHGGTARGWAEHGGGGRDTLRVLDDAVAVRA